jgi:protein SCO1/2
MKSRPVISRTRAACVSFAILLGAVAYGDRSAFAFSSLQPAVTRDLHFRQHMGATVPLGAHFRDANGQPVRLQEFFQNKPVLLVLDYLRCRGLCGVVLRDTVHALSAVPLAPGHDYEVVAISIDPRDTPADARRAASEYFPHSRSSIPGWHFLTGERSEIDAVANAVGFPFRYDPEIDQYAHPAGLVIATPGGTIARYILGVGYRPLDVRLALSEAARGTISSPVADLLLLCYCYDPGTGRYSFAISNLTRALCLLTVLGLGLWIFRLTRNRAESKPT